MKDFPKLRAAVSQSSRRLEPRPRTSGASTEIPKSRVLSVRCYPRIIGVLLGEIDGPGR